jgi:2'-5' RNA ligase
MDTYTDYLMLIAPPKNVIYDIGRYKRASARLIGDFPGMNSPAHISVNHQHRCKPFTARHAISQMSDKLGLLTPQELQISNFKYFTHGQTGFTIYACVVTNDHIDRWFKGLQSSMRIIQKLSVPHITVAKNISADKFKLLWPRFEQCKFQTSFIADKLTVLERETYVQNSRWQILKEFRFGERLMEY